MKTKYRIIALMVIFIFTSVMVVGCSSTNSTSSYNSPSTSYKYVGSINSNKYHYPSCEWAQKIYPENEIWFSSEDDAIAHGYVPCKVCRP